MSEDSTGYDTWQQPLYCGGIERGASKAVTRVSFIVREEV
jgi:hypothetical protein